MFLGVQQAAVAALALYHGTEGGENWVEGDPKESAVLSAVPAGRYHLNLYPVSQTILPVSPEPSPYTWRSTTS